MGRPLNKKYFGNRNQGTNGYVTDNSPNANTPEGDDKIGGEGVSSSPVFTPTPVANSVYTSGAYLDKMPHITAIDPPTIPGGVQAVADVSNVEAVFAVRNARGTGYQIGDIIEGTTGTGTKARFRVTQLRVLTATLSDAANSQNFDGGENLVWDSGVDSHWTTPTILTNVSSSGNPNYDITGWASFSGGVWDGGANYDPAPTTALTITGGSNTPNGSNPSYNTRGTGDLRGKVGGGAVDNNGSGGKVTFTYGIEAVEVVEGYQGNYTAVDSNAQAVTNITEDATGSNATLDIFYGVKAITVTQKGSGYVGTEAITYTAANSGQSETRAVGTVGLTADTGAVGSATNQENAIIIYANTDDQDSAPAGDIIKQVSTRRYKVKTTDGTAICNLVASVTPAVDEAYIKATDDNGNTYFVTKLTAHKATLVRWTRNGTNDWLYSETNNVAGWAFDGTEAPDTDAFGNRTYLGVVLIENA